jgi:hypothetical protein
MNDQTVDGQLRGLLERLEEKIKGYLNWCRSPAEQLLMLEFIRYALRLVPLSMSDRRSDAVSPLPDGLELIAEGLPHWEEEDGNTYIPAGLAWLPDVSAARAYWERGAKSCRLAPHVLVPDPIVDRGWSIDLALYWPMPEDRGHSKIAIECDEQEWADKTPEQAKEDKLKERFLQKRGWTVVRYSEAEILNDARSVVREIVDLAETRTIQTIVESRAGSPEGSDKRRPM